MGLRIPQSQIVTSKYTIGGEYILADSYKDYQGYYYETNGNFFVGKEFNINAPRLLKKDSDQVNQLKLNPATSTYAKISGIKLIDVKIESFQYNPWAQTEDVVNRYFTKNPNQSSILIKEINRETYDKLKSSPIYKSIILKWNTNGENDELLKKTENEFSGITAFLQDNIIGD